MMRYNKLLLHEIAYVFFMFSFLIWAFSSWLTHVIVCVNHQEWLFLIVGAMMIPVAWVHGTGVWFNVW